MPKRKLQFVQGAYYHIGNRGAGKQRIFHDDRDYLRAIQLMQQVSRLCRLTIIAYCLLPNHYHWLVRQDGPTPANQLPKRVFGSYTRTFNHRHNRTGTLFEDRFHGIDVNTDAYLRQLCLYIHANPLRHGVADCLDRWPYSNYLDWIGKRPGTLIDREFTNSYFGSGEQYTYQVQLYISGGIVLPEAFNQYLRKIEDRCM